MISKIKGRRFQISQFIIRFVFQFFSQKLPPPPNFSNVNCLLQQQMSVAAMVTCVHVTRSQRLQIWSVLRANWPAVLQRWQRWNSPWLLSSVNLGPGQNIWAALQLLAAWGTCEKLWARKTQMLGRSQRQDRTLVCNGSSSGCSDSLHLSYIRIGFPVVLVCEWFFLFYGHTLCVSEHLLRGCREEALSLFVWCKCAGGPNTCRHGRRKTDAG